MSKKKYSASTEYCFTLNKYTDDEYTNLKRFAEDVCRYAIIGCEVGESGTPHLQGYWLLRKRTSFKVCVYRYFPRCHVEIAAGSPDSNKRYCSKGGDYWEHGVCPRDNYKPDTESSSRKRVADSFVSCMERGRSGLVEFASEESSTYYFSGHNMLRNFLFLQPAVERPDVSCEWVYGEPGVGKSRYAHDKYPNAYIKEPRTKWWNNYLLEKEVIIDDFGPQGIDINHLLRWFDRYKCYVECKGGMLPLLACTFVVTSNFHPSVVFSFASEVNPQLPALLRRVSLIHME